MRRKIAILSTIICILFCGVAYASENNTTYTNSESTLVEIKDKELKTMEDYKEVYGSDTYGVVAFILNKVRIFSIPLAFATIAIGAIYQFIIGIRKLDVRDKGFNLIIGSVSLLVVCQVLPLVFAIVVKGWRG